MQRLLNHHSKFSVKFTAKLFWVIFIMEMEGVMHTKKPDDLQLFANLYYVLSSIQFKYKF